MASYDDASLGKITRLQTRIEGNSKPIEKAVNTIVQQYSSPLDEYMEFVRDLLINREIPPTLQELDQIIITLPTLMYFVGEAQEAIGIREDVAKAVRMEAFNEAREKAGGTIADKNTSAELASQNEYVVHAVYLRAYKKMRGKLDAAEELLQAAKRVMSRRIVELELSKMDGGRSRVSTGS